MDYLATHLPEGWSVEIEAFAGDCSAILVDPDNDILHVDAEGCFLRSAIHVARREAGLPELREHEMNQ
ncbi:MAG: hypothetical protein AB7G11_02315 [Phycisphaerales bacterium]